MAIMKAGSPADIRRERPGWYLFRDGCPGGESLAAVGARADRVIARLRSDGGRVLLFGHGQFFRVLGARWTGLTTEDARHEWRFLNANLCSLFEIDKDGLS